MTPPPLSTTPAQSPLSGAREGRPHAASLHRVARIILLATIFAAPWAIGAVQPWAWCAITGVGMLLVVLWGAGWVQRGVFKLTWSSLYLPFLALIVLALIQLFGHLTCDYPATREAVLKLVTDAVYFFLAGQLLFNESRSGKTIKHWGLMVLILAFGLSALAVAQVLTTGHGWIYWVIRTPHGPFGPYVSANDYCGLLEMLIPIAAGYILSGSSRSVPRVALWLMVGGCLGSVAMSGSRAGAAVILLEVLIFAAIAIRNRSKGNWHVGLALVLGLLLCSVGIFAWVADASREADRALSVFQTDKSIQVKMGDRLWVAKDTLRMALHYPVMGVGVGAFETVFPPYMSKVTDIHWTHAHDDFAEGLSETGVPGAALLLWGLILFLSLGYFHIRDRVRADWGWIPVGALVGASGLLFHSLVDFNLRIPANALWFVVCLAVATHPGTWPDRAPGAGGSRFPEPDESLVN